MSHTFYVIMYKEVFRKTKSDKGEVQTESRLVELKRRARVSMTFNTIPIIREMFKVNGHPYKTRCELIDGTLSYIIAENFDIVNQRVRPTLVKGFKG